MTMPKLHSRAREPGLEGGAKALSEEEESEVMMSEHDRAVMDATSKPTRKEAAKNLKTRRHTNRLKQRDREEESEMIIIVRSKKKQKESAGSESLPLFQSSTKKAKVVSQPGLSGFSGPPKIY